jgi:hypothetical protein
MTEDERERLTAYLKDVFDGRYVSKNDCSHTVEIEDKRITKLEIESAKINAKLGALIAILGTIGAAVVPVCIKLLFGG